MKRLLLYTLLLLLAASCKRTEVDVKVTAEFSYQVQDSNYSIPVRIVFTNKSSGAQFFKWTFEGGNPETYDKKEPGVISFNKAGVIKIKLEVSGNGNSDSKEIFIVLDSVPKADFTVAPVINNLGVTNFTISNNSFGGATKFNWSFTGGQPATSTDKNPAAVKYNSPGVYRIFLEASNDRGRKDTLSKWVTVLPGLAADFDIEPSFDDEDYQAPLTAVLHNKTISASQHLWSASGGTITNSKDSITTVAFNQPGDYTVTYKAFNGKDSATISKNINVLPNTGLRTFSNVKLGINTAQSTIGNYFSTALHKVIVKDSVNADNGGKIDIGFYGLSESFSYNLFFSPDSAKAWTFEDIPSAAHTKFINSLELSGVSFSVLDFDNLKNGSGLNSVMVTVSEQGSTAFSNALVPRIVLFENAAGKKGAIKIKQYVSTGQQSYILCDLKVQKD